MNEYFAILLMEKISLGRRRKNFIKFNLFTCESHKNQRTAPKSGKKNIQKIFLISSKMAVHRSISDVFKQSFCGVCGDSGISQFYSIIDSFIEYSGVFYSLREILTEALDLHVSQYRYTN